MTNPFQPFERPETKAGSPPESSAQGVPGADLSVFDKEFEETEAADFQDLPDGKYQVRIHAARLSQSQKGDPMIKWDLIVISGAHAGRHIFKNSVITSASLQFVKADLETLGLKLARFSELPNRLESLLDLTVEVTQRTRGDFTNVYFNRLFKVPAGGAGAGAGPGPGPGPGAPAPGASRDSVPF